VKQPTSSKPRRAGRDLVFCPFGLPSGRVEGETRSRRRSRIGSELAIASGAHRGCGRGRWANGSRGQAPAIRVRGVFANRATADLVVEALLGALERALSARDNRARPSRAPCKACLRRPSNRRSGERGDEAVGKAAGDEPLRPAAIPRR
jgi:hypothetical protein